MYKVGEFAKLIHVSVATLQRWDRTGVMVAHRTPTNRRWYSEDQYQKYIAGNTDEQSDER
ncbi:hypothetical protein FACS1894208_08120 [Clostridia bacterium]|nr:hypothetical protein FACS1894208_08120 [Clostridia bacterium]